MRRNDATKLTQDKDESDAPDFKFDSEVRCQTGSKFAAANISLIAFIDVERPFLRTGFRRKRLGLTLSSTSGMLFRTGSPKRAPCRKFEYAAGRLTSIMRRGGHVA